jgi:hypothetical protein
MKKDLEIALANLETRLVKWFMVALLAQGGLVVASIKLPP